MAYRRVRQRLSDTRPPASSLCGPAHAAPQDRGHLGMLQIVELVADRAVENPAPVPAPLPHNRDDRTLDPPQMIAGKGRGREHLVGGVDQHLILLRGQAETAPPP